MKPSSHGDGVSAASPRLRIAAASVGTVALVGAGIGLAPLLGVSWSSGVLGALTAAFALMGVALNAMLWLLVIQPVTRLAQLADRVSLGEKVPPFDTGAGDEIGMLARSFTRMRRSLDKAMDMLERGA